MINWLYTLPEWLVFVLAVAFSIALMFMIAHLVKRTPLLNDHSDHEMEFLIAIQSGLVALSAILLSFTLVLSLTTFERVDAAVANEASRLDEIDRLLMQFNDSKVNENRSLVKKYAQSIISDEWPMMVNMHEAENTSDLLEEIANAISAFEPSTMRQSVIYGELIRKYDELVEMRDSRLESARIGLHDIFWLVNFLILLGVLFTSAVAIAIHKTITVVGISFEVVALVGLVTMIFMCDRPFKGSASIQPAPFQIAIQKMEARKR
ncbi:MAG: DUF4239 domain-containing protein [Betaproteobacteria bacterium]|nr:DUF4239 domain-containing protein [Betaproteobacteria bacterium]